MEKLFDESNDFEKLFLDFKVMEVILVKVLVCFYNIEKGVFLLSYFYLKVIL